MPLKEMKFFGRSWNRILFARTVARVKMGFSSLPEMEPQQNWSFLFARAGTETGAFLSVKAGTVSTPGLCFQMEFKAVFDKT